MDIKELFGERIDIVCASEEEQKEVIDILNIHGYTCESFESVYKSTFFEEPNVRIYHDRTFSTIGYNNLFTKYSAEKFISKLSGERNHPLIIYFQEKILELDKKYNSAKAQENEAVDEHYKLLCNSQASKFFDQKSDAESYLKEVIKYIPATSAQSKTNLLSC
jgi:hypothetical protein